eukprot:138678_1
MYQNLILCVDASGSMKGTKNESSIKHLNQIVGAFGCETHYYKFGKSVDKISCYTARTLPARGGTAIEVCLKDLFSNHLRHHSASQPAKFIFVTDAEDSIRDTSGCISAKHACQQSYGNNLDCFCLLTGDGGSCVEQLKEIFGSNSFMRCSDNNFNDVLGKIVGNNKRANDLAESSDSVDAKIAELKEDKDADIRDCAVKIQEIQDAVATTAAKTKSAKDKIDETRANMADLDRDKATVASLVFHAINTGAFSDVDDATAKAEGLKGDIRKENRNLTMAGKELDDAGKLLNVQADKADAIIGMLKRKGSEIRNKAMEVIGCLVAYIKELALIQDGAYEQVSRLKGAFRGQLDVLMDLVADFDNLPDEFAECQKLISATFLSLKRETCNWKTFKEQMNTHMGDVNRLLERMDDL